MPYHVYHLFLVVCGLGMYSDPVTRRCEFCPLGQYQENTGQSSCHHCPFNTTTLYRGSADSSDCVSEYFTFFHKWLSLFSYLEKDTIRR